MSSSRSCFRLSALLFLAGLLVCLRSSAVTASGGALLNAFNNASP